MPKLTLADVTNLGGNPVSAQQVINTNSDRIEAAMEKTLSRDGSAPNQMESDLDMNHYKILNVKDLQIDGLDGSGIVEALIRERIERILGDLALSSLIGQAGAIEVPVFDTSIALGFADVKSTINSVRTGGYRSTNDGGGALYYRKSILESDLPGDKTSNGGTVRWGISDLVVNPRQFGAFGDNTNDDTQAIRDCVSLGRRVNFTKGLYVVTGEIEFVTPGQVIEFSDTGGYGYGENALSQWFRNSSIIARGSFQRRIRTRRNFRGSSSDPQDAPLSVVFNIQAEGVMLYRPSIFLDCDFSNGSPTNYGNDCDVGIFVGTRVGVQIHDPQITGYFRVKGVYLDFSGATNLPRTLSLDGTPYPTGTVKNGADGFHMFNPYIRGPKGAYGILGARPKVGQTGYSDPYYDEQLGTTVTDSRGSFGSSDVLVIGGRLYGPEHHSNYRWSDPVLVGGVLTEAGMLQEPDDAPCAVHIDGLAGNASGNGWGIRFIGTRIATFEAFRVRLDHASRVLFSSCHIEGRAGDGIRFSTSGDVINANDYVSTSYGDIAATQNTDRVVVLDSVRQSYVDGLAPHFYARDGKPTLLSSSGRIFLGNSNGFTAGQSGLDFRILTPGGEFLLREGMDSQVGMSSTGLRFAGTGKNLRWGTGESDIRSAGGSGNRFRSGSTTTFLVPPAGVYDNTTASAANTYISATNTLFRSTSSGRFKTQVEDIDSSRVSDMMSRLRPVWYRSLCDADKKDWSWYGLIAEEVAEIDPRFVQWKTEEISYEEVEVSEEIDVERVDDDGNTHLETDLVTYTKTEEVRTPLDEPVPDGVMYDRLVVVLISKVQELEDRLKKLEG